MNNNNENNNNENNNNENNNNGNVYWITGLSGAGKTTIGIKLYNYLKSKKDNVIRLDGDIMREVFQNKDYSAEGRKALGYQYARLCRMLSSQGIDVVICCIVMFDEVREWNRENIPNYHEIFLDVTMDELIKRNQKGIYTNAMNDKTQSVYGISINAELPTTPDLVIKNYGSISADNAFDIIVEAFEL